MQNSKNAYRDWYAAHGLEHNLKRRERYQTDPEYREKVKSSNLLHKQKIVANRPPKTPWRVIEVEDGGTRVRCVSLGALALAVGRTLQSLRAWERTGKIPVAPYRSNRGDRLYPIAMAVEIAESFHAQGESAESEETEQ